MNDMNKTKWTGLFSTVMAGTTITGIMLSANHLAKKYGQKPNPTKMYDVNFYNIIDYGINKFLHTEDNEILSHTENEISEKKIIF